MRQASGDSKIREGGVWPRRGLRSPGCPVAPLNLAIGLHSCQPVNRGYELSGEYEAAQSGYRIQMVAKKLGE